MELIHYLIILLIIYVLSAIIIGVYDIYRIVKKGKSLQARKEMLESLAGLHGYSPAGWGRYHEYQAFMDVNAGFLALYEEYKKNKWAAITQSILFSFIIVFVFIWEFISKQWIEWKANKKKKD